MKSIKNLVNKKIRREQALKREFYSLRSLLGYWWAIFLFLIGGREAGKSYAVTEFFIRQWRKYKRPFYWMRLTEDSKKKLLTNNAEKLIDPDLRRKYNLDLVTNGDNVYVVTKRAKPDANGKCKILKKELLGRVMALSTFYADKGSGLYDKDFLNDPNMYYNICLDEMNREQNERKSFDIVYSFANQLENIVRSTKTRIRVICIGNLLEEASDLLCAFNFLPEKYGRFKLHKKRAVIEYIEPTEAYLTRRKGTIADILQPNSSTFTNKINTDNTLVNKMVLTRPTAIFKFSKNRDDWFTLWDGKVIAKFHGEQVRKIPMLPYLDEVFNIKERNNVFEIFDSRGFQYRDLITFKQFQKNLELLRPRK